MARPLELEPIRLANGKWRVNVIAALSPTGKRQRLRFDTKQAALVLIEELKARRDHTAAVNRALSPTQLLDAASALELLSDQEDATLTEAAQIYLEVIKTRIASISLGELFDRFKAARSIRANSICAISNGALPPYCVVEVPNSVVEKFSAGDGNGRRIPTLALSLIQ